LDGNEIKIKDPDFIELEQFCEDFGFTELGVKLSDFRPSINLKEGATASEAKSKPEVKNADARGRIAAHEEKVNQHFNVIAKLQNEVTRLSTDFGRFVGEVS
jgi:hypothetical protein